MRAKGGPRYWKRIVLLVAALMLLTWVGQAQWRSDVPLALEQDAGPLISIVVATSNGEKYIEDCLQSVMEQSYTHWELLVVDDGSEDTTVDIVRSVLVDSSNAWQVLSLPHSGTPAVSRNVALRAAQGDWVITLDQDDLLGKDILAAYVEETQRDASLNVVYGYELFFDDGTAPTDGSNPKRCISPTGRITTMALYNVIHNAAMYRRTMWQQAGGYSVVLPIFEDWHFWLSLDHKGLLVQRCLDRVGLYYRIKESRSRNLLSIQMGTLGPALIHTLVPEAQTVQTVLNSHKLVATGSVLATHINSTLSTFPRNPVPYLWGGLQASHQGDNTRALELYEAAIDLFPRTDYKVWQAELLYAQALEQHNGEVRSWRGGVGAQYWLLCALAREPTLQTVLPDLSWPTSPSTSEKERHPSSSSPPVTFSHVVYFFFLLLSILLM